MSTVNVKLSGSDVIETSLRSSSHAGLVRQVRRLSCPSCPSWVTGIVLVFWLLFWAPSGLAGFLTGTGMSEQLSGLGQIIVAMPFLGALLLMSATGTEGMLRNMLLRAFRLSGAVLIGLIGFDLFAADGRGLWQHGGYLAMLMVSCVLIRSTPQIQRIGPDRFNRE